MSGSVRIIVGLLGLYLLTGATNEWTPLLSFLTGAIFVSGLMALRKEW